MNYFIDKSLIKNDFEVDLFNPKNKLLTRKYSSNSNLIITSWMEKYCNVYHKLFFEFNPSKLKFKPLKKNQNQTENNKIPSIEELLQELCTYYSEKMDNINFNKKILQELKKIFKTKKSKEQIIQLLSEWFNMYNEQIYNSTNYNNTQQLSFIQALEQLVNSKRNEYKNNNSNTSNNLINNKSDVSRFKLLLKLIIQKLNKFNQFTSFKIQIEIQNGFDFMYYYNDNELEFTIYSHTEIEQENIYWRFLYARMKSVLRMYSSKIQNMNNTSTKNTPQKTTIDTKIKFEIYLSHQTKQLPRKVKIFGPEEVNSGSTNFETINIWRKEEHFKLILHESVHFYNLDGCLDLGHQNEEINMECHYQIAADTETRLYEAYTESLAVFMHSFANAYQIYIMNLIESNKKKNNNNNLEWKELSKQDFEIINQIRNQLWIKEKKFFVIQIAKIFMHLNQDSEDFSDFLIIPQKCSEMRQALDSAHQLREKTSLLSYHILKGANMTFDQEFLEWMKNPFNPHPESLYKFYNYITEKTHNSDFINLVNQGIKFLKEKKQYDKNLRMTLYQTHF